MSEEVNEARKAAFRARMQQRVDQCVDRYTAARKCNAPSVLLDDELALLVWHIVNLLGAHAYSVVVRKQIEANKKLFDMCLSDGCFFAVSDGIDVGYCSACLRKIHLLDEGNP